MLGEVSIVASSREQSASNFNNFFLQKIDSNGVLSTDKSITHHSHLKPDSHTYESPPNHPIRRIDKKGKQETAQRLTRKVEI